MMKLKLLVILSISIVVMGACNAIESNSPMPESLLVDSNATLETKVLFANLDRIRHDYILFGHEDALAYGVNWRGDTDRSDVKDITGSHPAVYGWDVGHIELDSTMNLDKIEFDEMREHIRDAYRRGGVITISWHLNNPFNGASSWDQTPTVEHILPGRSHHNEFLLYMNRLADFLSSLVDDNGQPIPVIFRPWHEHTGNWFWWSARFTNNDEYAQLWRFTVEFLRDQRKINHLLYAYSPSNSGFETAWESYPGDEWVDIIGIDDYFTFKSGEERELDVKGFLSRLREVVLEAEKRGKIPAFTETGLEALPDSVWYTDFLLRGILSDEVSKRIAYILVWRNSNNATDRQNHYYAPFPGHPAEADFVKFYEHPFTLFESDLPDMYTLSAN